jgi:hypothetical protein
MNFIKLKIAVLFISIIFSVPFCINVSAQKVTFLIADAETHKIMTKVLVHSRLDGKIKQTTNNFGKTDILLAKEDTITIEKEAYYPLHLVVKNHKEYDYTHTITVYLTPISKHHLENTNLKTEKMQQFEYKFMHPELKNAPTDPHLEIHVFEHIGASEKRALWSEELAKSHQQFDILKVGLDKPKKK